MKKFYKLNKILIILALLIVINLKLFSQSSCDHYTWAVWTDQGSTNNATASLIANGQTISMSMTANYNFWFTSSIFNFGSFNGFSDNPPNSTVPATTWTIGAGGTTTMCFSQTVQNPVLLLSSIGNPNLSVPLSFSVPYSVLYDGGANIFIDSTNLSGQEGYCIIEFPGSFNCVTIFSNIYEGYTNLTWGIKTPPVADFTYNENCYDTINFSGFIVNVVNPVNISSWHWDFGDGSTSNLQNPTHLYSGFGNYNVQLVVTTNNNCVDTTIKTISVVNPFPAVNLGNDTTLAQGSTLSQNAGNAGSTYQWSTGDTTQQINITTTGTYWVKVTNAGGCIGSDTINVNFASTTLNIGNDTTICKGSSVTFKANAPTTAGIWEYNQDFENTIGNEWSDTNRITFNNTKVLGPYASYTVNLNLSNLPLHDSVEVSFDLYIHDTWDGNNSYGGPDFWSLFINNDTIINTTFANYPNYTQSFPQNYPSNNPLQTGAFQTNLPTRCFFNCGTSLYKISRKVLNISNNLQIVFNGNPIENICNESWSMDNVKVKLSKADTATHYLWSTGDTTQTITVTPAQTTTYVVTVTKGTTVYKDTATVYVMNPQVNLGSDTTICKGDSVKLIPNIIANTGICSKSQLPTNLQQGLVAFYPFCGNADDESGNSNNGTVHGATLTTDRFGNANSAYYFNGSTSTYIDCGNSNVTHLTTDISVSVWINYTQYMGTEAPRFICNGSANFATAGYEIALDPVNAYPLDSVRKVYFNWGNNAVTTISQSKINCNHWHHIVVVGTLSNMKIYIDGNLDNTSITTSNAFNFQSPFYIGRKTTPGYDAFGGKIDDIYVYNRALLASEVSQLFNNGNIASCHWSTGDTTQSITVSPNQTTNYTLTVTNGNGCSASDTITVNVVPPPVVNLGNDTTICIGDSVLLNSGLTVGNTAICDKSMLPANLQQGLVAFYPFCGNANDESGNGNNGTVNGATLTTDRFGNANSAFSFNGVSDYIKITNTFFNNGWQNYTISGWFNNTDISSATHVICNTDPVFGFWLGLNHNLTPINTFTMDVNSVANNPSWNILSTEHSNTIFQNNQWYFYTYVKDNNNYKLYINGSLDLDTNVLISPISYMCGMYLGISVDNSTFVNGFNGKLDDYSFYNRALSVSEVSQLYTEGNYGATCHWSTGDTTQTIKVVPNQTTTYSVNVTNSNGCSASDTIKVNVVPYPLVNLGSDTSICKGDNVKLIPSIEICNISQLPSNLQQGLVAFYPFCGNANDESGNGNNGIVNGATLTTDRFGNTNSAYSFDGLANIVCPTVGLLNNQFTYNLWVNTSSLPVLSATSPLAIGDNCADQALQLNTINQPCGWGFISYINCIPNPGVGGNSDSCPDINKWYNITLTRDSSLHKIFINGILVSSTTTNSINPSYGNLPELAIGSRPSNSQKFNGKIDDIKIYNRALTVSEISQLYTLGSSTSSSLLWSTGDTTQTITVSPSTTTNYTLTVTNSAGCSASDTITVYVIPLPVVNLGNDTTICIGDSVLLNSGLTVGNTLLCDKSMLPANLQQGLVAFYPFCGNANDESGNGNNGTVNGATLTTDRFGNANSAYSFNGASNYIQLNNSSLLSPTDAISISVWVKYYSVTTSDELIFDNNSYVPWYGYDLQLDASYNIKFGIHTSSYLFCNNTPVLPINSWQHIVVLYDGQNSKIYLNNILVGSCSITGLIDYSVIVNPVIGSRNDHSAQFFKGNIDDLIIYNRALSASEINQLFTLGTPSSLSCHWSTGDTTHTIKVAPSQTTTYSVNVTNSNGCSASDSIKVNVSPLPLVNLGTDTSICQGNTLNLNAGNAGSTYQWQDNSTNQIYSVNQQGTYWVKVTTPIGCKSSDTINIVYNPATVVNLGNDTAICQGETLILDATLTNATYLWQDGSTNATFNVSSQGTYWVKVTNSNGCTASDTIHVTLTPLVVNIGNDTTICQGNNVTLDAGNMGSTYLWSTGVATQQINVNSSGAYWVKVTNGNCFNSDTININVIPKPLVNLGNDTTICHLGSITLNAGNAGSTYLWNTTATTQQINVSTTGNYWVNVSNNGCIGGDTINIAFIPLNVNIGNDTTICEGDNITLNAANTGSTYLWNTGVATQTISAGTAGNFWVNVTNGNCTGSDTININVAQKPVVNLGNDTIMCPGDLVVLSAGAGFSSYLWSDGSTQPTLNVNNPGTYTVTVSNSGCKATDLIVIAECNSDIWVPNVFTPNGDGKNDTFHPVCKNITDITMYIYNRWGNQIYQGSGVSLEWDGKYQGTACPDGVYYYLIEYTQKSNNHTTQKQSHGSVTLLK